MNEPHEPLSVDWVARTYGALIPVSDLAKILGFPSTAAVRRANGTGRLGFQLRRIEGRRGLYANAKDVSTYLTSAGEGR